MGYWLSNASTLLLLLQRTLKAGAAAGNAPQHRRSTSATIFGRMTLVGKYARILFVNILYPSINICTFFQSFRGVPQGANISLLNEDSAGTLRQVDAKYPALLFKQQLTAYVEKIYGMIRDNLKKEISPQLGLCIQVCVPSIF